MSDFKPYYEVRMINNDLFKTTEDPLSWSEYTVDYGWRAFQDMRSGETVMVNLDVLASVRQVTKPESSQVGQICDDEFVSNIADVSGQVLSQLLGRAPQLKQSDEVLVIDDDEKP